MADIFISYSKTDHELVAKLSAFLEAEGWIVWWDKSLKPADTFRDEIMKELAKARAVITIWTENSIHSDWVRAEAGRAKADGKLIPLKSSDVAYADIPLPFGEMHTENVSSLGLIRAAVVGQLAKPAVTPSALRMTYKTLRYQFLTWGGIIGGALTLFTNLGGGGVIGLAKWARALVTHWLDWLHTIWVWIFAWIGIEIPKAYVPILSFLSFMMMILIGINLRRRLMLQTQEPYEHHVQRPLLKFMVAAAIILVVFGILFVALIGFSPMYVVQFVTMCTMLINTTFGLSAEYAAIIVLELLFVFPFFAIAVVVSKEKWNAFALCLLCTTFSAVMVFVPIFVGELLQPLRGPGNDLVVMILLFLWIGFIPIVFIAMVIFTPIRLLTKRLGSVAVGLFILLSLNEISKLDLGSYLSAPK